MRDGLPARIFISYSHRGNGLRWKQNLLAALQVFEKHHLLDVWQDGLIRVGSFWDDDIKQAMEAASIAIVLLTDDALKSQYILEVELPYLEMRQQRDNLPVFPVICEPCDWRAHGWLRATQAANGSVALSTLSVDKVEAAFCHLATEVADKLSRLCLAGRAAAAADPPPHTYLDRFPLAPVTGSGLKEDKLVGREQDLALLDLAFGRRDMAIVCLVALGGVGKSMLVRHWLRRLQRGGWWGVRRVYAWSFYSQGMKEDRVASEDLFLSHALEWFQIAYDPTLPPWDKGKLLADAVTQERTLLILDGVEPLQFPPGPMGGRLRAPGVHALLKRLAVNAEAGRGSLCLVTTREPLADLPGFQDAPGRRVLHVSLGNLTVAAGAALLHHVGANRAGAAKIKADDAELLTASREVDGHALTLNLLGRFLARAHAGDVRSRAMVRLEEADREVQGGTTFKVLRAFESWFSRGGEFSARQLTALRILGLFDRPADTGCLNALRTPPSILGLTGPLFISALDQTSPPGTVQPLCEEDWATVISFLTDFGLVEILASADGHGYAIDCHPLIRQYFSERLLAEHPEAWRAGNRRLYEHLAATTEYRPETIDGLQPLYQAAMHGCRAGLGQAALETIYKDRILRGVTRDGWYSTLKLGALSENLACQANFFTSPWGSVDGALPEDSRVMLYAQTANLLRASGRLNEALEPNEAALAICVARENWRDAARRSGNLAHLLGDLGQLHAALLEGERSLAYAARSDDLFERLTASARHADVLHQAGQFPSALAAFQTAEELLIRIAPDFPLLHLLPGIHYCDLLLAEAERSFHHLLLGGTDLGPPTGLNECRTTYARLLTIHSWHENRWASVLDKAMSHLLLAKACLFLASFQSPVPGPTFDFDTAITQLRQAQNAKYVVRGLLARAAARRAWLEFPACRADLDEAWDIAERGPMRLLIADVLLNRARFFFRQRPYPWQSPADDLATAESLISDCGYYRRSPELAAARLMS